MRSLRVRLVSISSPVFSISTRCVNADRSSTCSPSISHRLVLRGRDGDPTIASQDGWYRSFRYLHLRPDLQLYRAHHAVSTTSELGDQDRSVLLPLSEPERLATYRFSNGSSCIGLFFGGLCTVGLVIIWFFVPEVRLPNCLLCRDHAG